MSERDYTPANVNSWKAKSEGLQCTLAPAWRQRPGPGEVLVSSTVKDLVAGSGIGFRDRGVVELKGVPGDWRLYSVEQGAASR